MEAIRIPLCLSDSGSSLGKQVEDGERRASTEQVITLKSLFRWKKTKEVVALSRIGISSNY